MRLTTPLCFLLIAGVLSGCTRTVITEGPAPARRVDGIEIRMNSVAILDRELDTWYVFQNTLTGGSKEHGKKGKIAVESTNSRRTASGTLEAWALLRNRTGHALQVEGRVLFFDKDRAPLEGPTAWQRIFLPGNGVDTYRGLSTGVEGIAYYYIEIREGR